MVLGPNTITLRDSIVAEMRESQQSVFEAAAQAETLNARMNDVEAVAGYANTRTYDAREWGSLTGDVSTIIQNALNEVSALGGGRVAHPFGTYTLGTALSVPAGVTYDLNGATLDFSGMTTAINASCISDSGTFAALPALNATVAKDATTVTFASAHNLQIGDWFNIWNPADFSFSTAAGRPYYRNGQWCLVAAVIDSTTVRIQGKTYASYPTTCQNNRLIPGGGSITNGRIIGKAGVWGVTKMLAAGFTLDNLVIERAENGLVQLFKCVDFTIQNVRGNSRMSAPAGTGDNYGIVLGNCQQGIVTGNRVRAQWHAFSTGGGGDAGSVPCRDIIVAGNHFRTMGNVSAVDTHGNTEHVIIANNQIDGGVSVAGDHITVAGNTIFGGSGPMPIQTGDEILGGDIAILNNTIHVQGGGTAGQGFIQFWLRTTMTRSGGTLTIRGNRIFTNNYQGPSASTSVVQVYNLDATGLISLDIGDNEIHSGVSAPTSPASYWDVYVRCATGKAFLAVRITGKKGGRGSVRGQDLNCRLLTIENIETLDCASGDAAIYINDNPTPVYTSPLWRLRGMTLLNSYAQSVRLAGLAGTTLELAGSTLLNANVRGDAGATGGANIWLDTFATVTLRDNTWGSSVITRRLYVANVAELEEIDNKTLGSVTTDTFSSVTNRYLQVRQGASPVGSTIASPGSVVICASDGNVYRKASGVMDATGWTAL